MKILFTILLFLLANLAKAQETSSSPITTIKFIGLNRSAPGFSDSLRKDFAAFYRVEIDTTSIKSNVDTPINAVEFLKAVEDTLTSSPLHLLLFTTDIPIFIAKEEYELRGLATRRAAIVSSHKIKAEALNSENYYFVLLKTVLHETGHLFGLQHCETDCSCLMVSSLPDPTCFLNSQNRLCKSCTLIIKAHIR
jgi:predicted Zn-dependent protease